MKIYFIIFIQLFFIFNYTLAQKVITWIKPDKSKILLLEKNRVTTLVDFKEWEKKPPTDNKNKVIYPGVTIKDTNQILIGYQSGYLTQAKPVKELFGKNQSTRFQFNLVKWEAIPDTIKTKKIKFSQFVNAEGKHSNQSTYTPFFEGIKLQDPAFNGLFSKFISELRFNAVELNPLFIEKTDVPDLVVGGEIEQSGYNTIGDGFQAAVRINWSVYDFRSKKVVLQVSTYGYSDLKSALKFKDQLILALKDALLGLLMDSEFKQLAISFKKKPNESDIKQPISIDIVPAKKFEKYSDMVKSSTQSVVAIKSSIGFGSGFLISADGYVLTNHHVVDGSDIIEVVFENGFAFPAEVVRYDEKRDVALLRISGKGFKPLPLNIGSEVITAGEEVIAIGTPLDIELGQTVTKGIISGKRQIENQRFVQTDVSINPGNSGGPLLNENGEVIGIIVSRREDQNARGIGFAIPINDAIDILKMQLK